MRNGAKERFGSALIMCGFWSRSPVCSSAAVEVRTWLAKKRLDDAGQRYSTWRVDSLRDATWEIGFLDNYNFSNWPDEKRKLAEPEYKRVADWYRAGTESLEGRRRQSMDGVLQESVQGRTQCRSELETIPRDLR